MSAPRLLLRLAAVLVAVGWFTAFADSAQAQPTLRIITIPSDALDPTRIRQIDGVNDGDGNAGPPPAAETVDHAIDGVGQKYLNFLDLGSGFAVTPSLGSTLVTRVRLYTANDAVPRDPASILIEGSNGGFGGTFTTI